MFDSFVWGVAMSVLKVRCPECDTAIRQTIDAVDEPTDFTLTCPKCQAEFVAEAQPERPPAKQAAKKPVKAARRQDDDEDDEDDTPRKRKKQAASGPNTKLLVGGIAVALLAVGGIVAAVIAMSGGDKDKNKDQAKADPPAQPVSPKVQEPTTPQPETKQQKQQPKDQTSPPKKSGSTPITKAKDNDDEVLIQVDPRLPAPPKVRLSGTPLAGGGKLDAKVDSPPPFVPIAKDEDPFLRARSFAPDGPVPPLAKLPPPNQRPILTLDPHGHSAFVNNVFFTPRGDQVVTVGSDKAVRIWDIKTGEPVSTIRLPAGVGEEGELNAASLSWNGKRLAVAGIPLKGVRKGAIPIFIINIENGTLAKTIAAARDEVTSLDFSPDGNRIAVGCLDGTVQIFNAASGASVNDVPAHRGLPVAEVRFSPTGDSKVVATLGRDGTVRIWDSSNPSRTNVLSVGTIGPNTIGWSSNGQTLAVGGRTGDILLFGLDGRLIRSLPKQTYGDAPVRINRLVFISGDHEILCCGAGGGPKIGWAGVIAVETGVLKATFTEHTNVVYAVNCSPDGKQAVTSGGNQHETYVWNIEDGKVVSRLCGTGNGMWGVGWAKDGRSVGFGTSNHSDDEGNNPIEATFRFDDMGPAALTDSSKYQQAIKADSTYGIARLDRTTWALVNNVTKRALKYQLLIDDYAPQPIYSASVIPNKRMVVFCGAVHLVGVDPETGKVVRRFNGHNGNILSVAPSPDGRYFVTGSSDQTIRVWNPAFEEPLMSICVAGREWIAWTPEGYYACSAHGEQLIAWQINTGANKFPQIHPAARFRSSMYQPALIKYLIPAGSMPLAMAMAKKYDKILVQTTSVADIVPPEVALESPGPDTGIVDQETFTVKAVAKGVKQPITSMRLLMDGRPYQGAGAVKKFEKPELTAEATWEVPLTPGQHTFAVIAESTVSRSISKLALITRSGTPPKPNLYVLAMGISAYPAPNTLHYCAVRRCRPR